MFLSLGIRDKLCHLICFAVTFIFKLKWNPENDNNFILLVLYRENTQPPTSTRLPRYPPPTHTHWILPPLLNCARCRWRDLLTCILLFVIMISWIQLVFSLQEENGIIPCMLNTAPVFCTSFSMVTVLWVQRMFCGNCAAPWWWVW